MTPSGMPRKRVKTPATKRTGPKKDGLAKSADLFSTAAHNHGALRHAVQHPRVFQNTEVTASCMFALGVIQKHEKHQILTTADLVLRDMTHGVSVQNITTRWSSLHGAMGMLGFAKGVGGGSARHNVSNSG